MILYRITAPHFCAGAVWVRGDAGWRCNARQCAPILRWMIGKTAGDVRAFLRRKGWTIERIKLQEAA